MNISGNCFINAVIQALLSVDIFREYMNVSNNRLLKILRDIVDNNLASLEQLMAALPWHRTSTQECAHETLTFIIDQCNLSEYTQLKYKRIKICQKCGNSGLDDDLIPILLVEPRNQKVLTEQDIECFSDRVEACTCGLPFQIVNILYSVRNILIVAFNKFGNKFLTICPKQLIFHKSPSRDRLIYRIKAQIDHMGAQHSGHYYAYVNRGDKWYIANDFNIHPIPDVVQTPNTYIVIYELSK